MKKIFLKAAVLTLPLAAGAMTTFDSDRLSKSGGCHSLIVSDLLGKVVYSNTITGNGLQNIDINTVKLAAGSYTIRVTGGKEPKIAKLTVTH